MLKKKIPSHLTTSYIFTWNSLYVLYYYKLKIKHEHDLLALENTVNLV